jgi:hypothetical protein
VRAEEIIDVFETIRESCMRERRHIRTIRALASQTPLRSGVHRLSQTS